MKKKCWDFPEMVLHHAECPRYTGGVCHPMPTPTPPYTEEEAKAVESYHEMRDAVLKAHETGELTGGLVGFVRATGRTGNIRKPLD